MGTPERKIEVTVCRYAEVKHKCITIKLTGYRGIPDRLIVFPNGSIIFIEFKSPSGRLQKNQKIIIDKLIGFNVRAYVVNCIMTGKKIIDDVAA